MPSLTKVDDLLSDLRLQQGGQDWLPACNLAAKLTEHIEISNLPASGLAKQILNTTYAYSEWDNKELLTFFARGGIYPNILYFLAINVAILMRAQDKELEKYITELIVIQQAIHLDYFIS